MQRLGAAAGGEGIIARDHIGQAANDHAIAGIADRVEVPAADKAVIRAQGDQVGRSSTNGVVPVRPAWKKQIPLIAATQLIDHAAHKPAGLEHQSVSRTAGDGGLTAARNQVEGASSDR